MQVREFIDHHYRHFNAATVKDAAQAYEAHLAAGGKMFVTLAGAMSTAELGLSLAEMIRQDKVHAITCTGANLEEDVYNLVAHEFYKRVPNYRDLTPQQEEEIRSQHLARVTDTCIPEEEAMRRIDRVLLRHWQSAGAGGASKFVHEYLYDMLLGGDLEEHYQIDPRDSWLMAAAQKNLPLFVPGWEDCTLGNACASWLINGQLENKNFLKYGLDYMIELGALVSRGQCRPLDRLLSNWRRDRWRFSDLRRANAQTRFAHRRYPTVGLLLSDLRQHHQLRVLFGGRSQRKDHMEQTDRGYTEVHHRVRRHDRGAVDVRVSAQVVVRGPRAGKAIGLAG